jgi:hypothetical protein
MRQVEDRFPAMMDSARSLPPPPSHWQMMPSTTPSPSSSRKDSSGRWQASNHKLTHPKEKDSHPCGASSYGGQGYERERRGTGGRSAGQSPLQPLPQTRSAPPSSPTPSRPNLSTSNTSPSPARMSEALAGSQSRHPPATYAPFNSQATLHVPSALMLVIARRYFAKVEKRTIRHVRVLVFVDKCPL